MAWHVRTGDDGFLNQGQQNRTITSVPSTNRIIISGNFGTGGNAAFLHDILTNPGFVQADPITNMTSYTIVGINSQTDFLVKPNDGQPNITAVPSNAQIKKVRENVILEADTAITAAFTADTITAGGATFETNGVTRGDRLSVAGSTSNDGSWVVKNVISETVVQITGTFTVEAAAGTCEVRRSDYYLDIVDEATVNWDTLSQNVPAGMATKYTPPGSNTISTHYSHRFGQIRVGYSKNTLQPNTPVTTAFAANGVVIASGALFITNGVSPGDIVQIGGGINSGSYVVDTVDSETQITVDATFIPQSTVIDVARAITLFQIIGGDFRVTCAGATYTTDPVVGLGSIATIAGSTSNDGVYDVHTVASATALEMLPLGIAEAAAGTMKVDVGVEVWQQQRFDWVSTRELVVSQAGDMTLTGNNLGSLAEPLSRFQIGTDVADIYGSTNPSVYVGTALGSVDQISTVDVYGSCIAAAGGAAIGPDSDAKASLITGPYNHPFAFGLGGGISESVIINSDGLSAVAFGVLDSQNNLLVTHAPGLSVILGANVELVGLLFANIGVANPFLATLGANVDIVDAREDYAMSRLFTLFGAADVARKLYTYNPRFVKRNEATLLGEPLAGLVVQITEINETTQAETAVSGSPFTTDANGQLNAGAGVRTVRGYQNNTTGTIAFSVRIKVEGAGFRQINQVVQFASRFDGDVIVDFLRPDFEHELST